MPNPNLSEIKEAAFWESWICLSCGAKEEDEPEDKVCQECEGEVVEAAAALRILDAIEPEGGDFF